ncbi:MAG: PTS sugar transporter subunit IIA [Lentisphaeria bacterium]|nr:PTS sugar transporter subunit IIA [Lentisphaeria bacterium]
MQLASILNAQLISRDFSGKDRRSLYREMVELANKEADLELNVEDTLNNMLEREDATRIPYSGMALPHLRVPSLNDMHVVIAIIPGGIKLNDYDMSPSNVVIMSLISENTSSTYLRMLSAFTRYLMKPANLQRVAAAHDGDDFLRILREDGVMLKNSITAEDVMEENFDVIHADDKLAVTLDIFNRKFRPVLPVVDADNHLIGQINAANLIKKFIPDYVLMMDNLKFLSSFEPFEQIFKEENDRLVRDFIEPPKMVISPKIPLIQFTVELAKRHVDEVFVTDSDNKLLGVIAIRNIIHKILRG